MPVAQQPAPQPLGPAQAAPLAASKQVSIEELLADTGGDDTEKWLIQKDRLDFGPFAMGDLKQQIYKREFSGDDVVVDQETGERSKIRTHPAFRDFIIQLDRLFESKRMAAAEVERTQQDKRRRSILVVVVLICLAVLGAGGAAAVYFIKFKEPETREKIVYRTKKDNVDLSKIQIAWSKEPEDQAKKRRKWRKRRKRRRKTGGAGVDDDVTRFGDATKSGGDALLSQRVIQGVMNKSFSKLTGCVYKALRSNPGMRSVVIDFGIRGTGRVSSVRVNKRGSGPFHGCIKGRMRAIKFPSFDGSLTRASFAMSLK
jgi:hypothetical protein